MKILAVNDYDGLYGKFWGHLGEIITDVGFFYAHPGQIDLVCFTGGEDVSPELYGHQNLGSGNNRVRDSREAPVFHLARKCQIPMTGICRGSQFLNVMCGGTMVQHLKASHGGGRHWCLTADGQEFLVTSSHHQMSVLGEGGIYLGWSKGSLPSEACVYDGDINQQNLVWVPDDERAFRVTEAFAYPEQKIFAVQHHPEWQDINDEAPQWTLRMIQKICLNQNLKRIEGKENVKGLSQDIPSGN